MHRHIILPLYKYATPIPTMRYIVHTNSKHHKTAFDMLSLFAIDSSTGNTININFNVNKNNNNRGKTREPSAVNPKQKVDIPIKVVMLVIDSGHRFKLRASLASILNP
jgi:hypothetical protein